MASVRTSTCATSPPARNRSWRPGRKLIEAAPDSPPTLTCSYYPEVFRQTGRAFSALATCWRIGNAPDTPETTPPLATYPDLTLHPGTWPASARAGEAMDVVLTWSPETALDYGTLTTFVHVLDAEGNVMAQVDAPLPTSPASTGQLAQRYRLWLPRTLLPGEYRLAAGVYPTASGAPSSTRRDTSRSNSAPSPPGGQPAAHHRPRKSDPGRRHAPPARRRLRSLCPGTRPPVRPLAGRPGPGRAP